MPFLSQRENFANSAIKTSQKKKLLFTSYTDNHFFFVPRQRKTDVYMNGIR
jgi:hypothetical protein